MNIQPAQPQSIGGVLDTAFQLYKASVVPALPLSALMAVASTPPSIYMLMRAGTGSATDPFATLAVMQSPGYWITYLVSILATMWIMGALYYKIASAGSGEPLGVGEALTRSSRRALSLFFTTILFGIAIAIGLVLLIIPGLILMISLMLCFNLNLFEEKGPVASLIGSHQLVWGNWWRTAAILTVGFIVLFVIYMLAGVIAGLFVPLIGIDLGDVLAVTMVSTIVISVVVTLVVTPFYLGLAIAIYWDLKLRKEGGDLASRVGTLNAA